MIDRIRSLALVLVCCLASAGAAGAQDAGRIGTIDSQRIFAEYQEAKDAETIFQQEMDQWQSEIEQQ